MGKDEPVEGAPPVHDLEGRHAAALVVVAGGAGEGKEVFAHVDNCQNMGLIFHREEDRVFNKRILTAVVLIPLILEVEAS